ncbi:MAG: Hpt domain-containing protein [Anaerolineales bacterium]|nr:Hpt domain-containing protein [Anaerolineales bacterium]
MNFQTQSTLPVSQPESILKEMNEWLTETLGDSAEFMIPELAEMFLEDAPSLVQMIQYALSQNDVVQVRNAAHTLKGSSASMGLHIFSKHCKEIETQAKTGNLAAAAKQFPQFEAEYMQVVSALQTIVE